MQIRGIALLLAAISLSACLNEETVREPDSRASLPISFAACSDDMQTRADVGDLQISGFRVLGDQGSKLFMDETVIYDGSNGVWKPSSGKVYYALPSPDLRFYAYYSALSRSISHTPGSAPAISVTNACSQQDDLLVANGTADEKGTVNLKFSHAMTGVWFSVANGSMPGTVSTITLSNVKDSGTYTIGTGWTATSGSTSCSRDLSNLSATNHWFLIPQTLGTVTITFTPQGGSVTNLSTTLPATSLAAGYKYEFQLTISQDQVTVSSVTINSWSANNTVGTLSDTKQI